MAQPLQLFDAHISVGDDALSLINQLVDIPQDEGYTDVNTFEAKFTVLRERIEELEYRATQHELLRARVEALENTWWRRFVRHLKAIFC